MFIIILDGYDVMEYMIYILYYILLYFLTSVIKNIPHNY